MAGGFSTARYEETSAELMALRAAVVPTPGNLEALAHLLCVELCAEPSVTSISWATVVEEGCDKEWLDLAGKVYDLLLTRAAAKLSTPAPGPVLDHGYLQLVESF